MLGRGGRIKEGKTHFTVLDFGGNKDRFGPYDVDRDWSLWHEETKPGGGIPPMKVCGEDSQMRFIKGAAEVKKGCGVLIMASYKLCPFCGFKYPAKDKAKEAELTLAAIVDEKGVSLKTKAFKNMTFEELYQYREIKKHHIAWLYRMLWIRDKEKTIKAYALQYNWTNKQIYYAINFCKSKYK